MAVSLLNRSSDQKRFLIVQSGATHVKPSRGLAKTIRERLGYRVLIAGTPGEAIRWAKSHADEIQLLITDVVMPGMNGREMTRFIGEIIPGLKYLFISGNTADVMAHHGVMDEGLNFLQKPFFMKSLASKVRMVLNQV